MNNRQLAQTITLILICLFLALLCIGTTNVFSIVSAIMEHISTDKAETVIEVEAPDTEITEPVQAPTLPVLEIPDLTPPEYDTDVVEALAKMVYGEARGCSTLEQAATVWCVLNRVDNANSDILSILQAPHQFQGYRYENPVKPELVAVVEDVLIRWEIEKKCVGEVGRVLPSDYLWFSGDGKHNHFRNEFHSSTVWDWSLPNPYEVTNNE